MSPTAAATGEHGLIELVQVAVDLLELHVTHLNRLVLLRLDDLLDLGLARIRRRFEGRHAPLAGPAPQPLRLDLRAQILDQEFREDLHGRLGGVPYSTGNANVNKA